MSEPLRIGVLGAARINELAILEPARLTGARLVAVAARDRSRAEIYAQQNGFDRALDSYDAVINDPQVEAIYNPLPNSLHAPWNLAALRAGKHVLSEKPFASNAAEARRVADAARGTGSSSSRPSTTHTTRASGDSSTSSPTARSASCNTSTSP